MGRRSQERQAWRQRRHKGVEGLMPFTAGGAMAGGQYSEVPPCINSVQFRGLKYLPLSTTSRSRAIVAYGVGATV